MALQMSTHSMELPGASLLKKFAVGCLATLLLVLFPSLAGGQTAPEAQSAPAPEASELTPTINANVDEVSLNLVVRDKKHNLILDLKPEDIAVTDNGAPMKLTGIHLVHADAATSTDNLITLVFDTFRGAGAKNIRDIADKVLALLPAKGYSFAVLDFTNRLRLIQGFTEDRQAVQNAIHIDTESQAIILSSTLSLDLNIVNDKQTDAAKTKAASAAEKNLIATAQTGVDLSGRHVDLKERAEARALLTALQDAQAITLAEHTQLNLAGLLALVKSQQSIGDRKALIYFTVNQQLSPAAKEMLKTITAAATRAGVSLYIVDMDAMGNSNQYQEPNALLNAPPPFNPTPIVTSPYTKVIPMQQESSAPIQGDPSPEGPVWTSKQDIAVMTDFMRSSGEDRTNPFADTKNPMAGLAKASGGAYIDALRNTRKPLLQMAEDMTTYYQATYVPPFKEYDGKFRAIAVKSLRSSLNIQTRPGYFAVAPGAEAGIRPFEAPLLKTLAAPQLPSDVKFHAALLRFGDLPDGNTNSLAVEVPLSSLETKAGLPANPPSAHVSIVAQIKDQSGVVVEHYAEDITRSSAPDALAQDPSAAISREWHFITAPGSYTMEVAVLDQNNGKAGAQRSNFEIKDFSSGVSLSDMVLVRKMERAHGEDEDTFEPLRYEHRKVTPNITAELPANSRDVQVFFLLHSDSTSKEPTKLEMELVHNGKPGRRIPLLQTDGMHQAIPYLASIGSGQLSPGQYEVKAFLSQGGKTAEQSQAFTVAGTPGAEADHDDWLGIAGAVVGTDAESSLMGASPVAPQRIAITPLANPAPALSSDEARLLLEAARQRALDYNDILPNFVCTEITSRSVDANGDGRWKLKDTFVETLRYSEKTETRTMQEVNGKTTSVDRDSMKGVLSAGEFGGILQAVFRNESKADFQWKEAAALNGHAVQVYNYRVDRGASMFSVTGLNGKQLIVGFHGQAFIDSATRRARRITLIADDLPADFPTHATSIGVNYDYVPINGLKYLMPVSAELKLSQGHRELVMNTMQFKDYNRFPSK
jgi:VWFA-related protein